MNQNVNVKNCIESKRWCHNCVCYECVKKCKNGCEAPYEHQMMICINSSYEGKEEDEAKKVLINQISNKSFAKKKESFSSYYDRVYIKRSL